MINKMSTIITDLEAKEAGVKKEVLQKWNDLMQALWTAAIFTFKATGDENIFPKNEDNQIFIGNRFKIDAAMVNNSFAEARLWEGETQLVEIRYEGISVTTICKCIFIVIKDSIKS